MRNLSRKGNTQQSQRYSSVLLKEQLKQERAALITEIKNTAADALLAGSFSLIGETIKVDITDTLSPKARLHHTVFQDLIVIQNNLGKLLAWIEDAVINHVYRRLGLVDDYTDLQSVYTKVITEICSGYPELFMVYNAMKFGYRDGVWSDTLVEMLKEGHGSKLRMSFYADAKPLLNIMDVIEAPKLSTLIGEYDASPKHLIHAALNQRLTTFLRDGIRKVIARVPTTPERKLLIESIYRDIGFNPNKNHYRQGSHSALLIYGIGLDECRNDDSVQRLVNLVASLRGK